MINLSSCSALKKKSSPKNNSTIKPRPLEVGPSDIGDGSFVDMTEQYGLGDVTATHIYAVDLNNDGYTDIVTLPEFYSQPNFYYWNPSVNKYERYHYTPFTKAVKASFLYFADVDGDKIIDVFIGVMNQKSELTKHGLRFYKGSLIKGKLWFTHQDIIQSRPFATSSLTLLDVNLDGHLDIYLGNWFEERDGIPTPQPDRLLMWEKDKWIDRSSRLQTELELNDTKETYINATPTYGSSSCDIDDDGFPDVLTASTSGYSNKLWNNKYRLSGNMRYFTDIGAKTGYAKDNEGFHVPRGGGRTFFSSCADYNNDGLMDVYMGELTHSYDSDSVDRSSVLTSVKPNDVSFLRTEYLADSSTFNWNRGDKRAIWFDYNLDGKLDILVMNTGYPPYSRLVLFEQDEFNDFLDVAKAKGIDVLNPQGSVILDVNQDGRMDILTSQNNVRNTEIKAKLYLFQNNVKTKSRSLRFYPRGINANTFAIGAMIKLELKTPKGIESRRHWVEYVQGGLPSQNEEGVVFGIRENDRPLSVTVRWPVSASTKSVSRVYRETSYKLDGVKLKASNSITLCEDGRLYLDKRFCH